ncbi:MAG: hypothetical protein ACRD0L_15405 [Acidimicrobiales bacterium]
MRFRASHVPLRLAAGTFILESGLSHVGMADEHARRLHGMATGAYPGFERLGPRRFGQVLAAGEIALGGVLLAPFVPSGLAGLGLAAFSGSLLGMYARTPALHREGSMRPSAQGVVVAKDSWLAGIAAALILDQVASARASRRQRRLRSRVASAQAALADERAKQRGRGAAVTGGRRGRAAARAVPTVAKAVPAAARAVSGVVRLVSG